MESAVEEMSMGCGHLDPRRFAEISRGLPEGTSHVHWIETAMSGRIGGCRANR